MTQLSHFCAHAARLGQYADTLRDLADRLAREDDMEMVEALLSDAISELGSIARQHDAAMKRATEMHTAIRICTGNTQ